MRPFVPQSTSARAPNVDPVKTAGDRIEPRRIDNNIEFVLGLAGSNSRRRNPLDRRLLDVHQPHIGLVVNLVIPGLQRHPPRAEPMIPRDQHLRHHRVPHPPADFPRHKAADRRVRRRIDQNVPEIALPNAEPALGIKLLEKRLPLLRTHLKRPARVRRMQKTRERLLAPGEHLRIPRLDPCLGRRVDRPVMQRRAPVRCPLKHG